MTRRASAVTSLAALVVFAFLMHWPVFVLGKTVSAFDVSYFAMEAYRSQCPPDLKRPSNGLLSDPVRQFNVWDKAMYEGPLEFPWLWDPYAGCGSPLLANAQSAPYYPLKLLAYAPCGVYRGFGFLCFLKMLLAGLFMWAYMRALKVGYLARTFGALAFMACGFMVAWLQWPLTSVALTLPLVCLGAEYLVQGALRRGLVIVASATALGLLGGHPETSFHIAFAGFVYMAARLLFLVTAHPKEGRSFLRAGLIRAGVFLAAIALGATVAGAQVLPNVEYIQNSAALQKRQTWAASYSRSLLWSQDGIRYAKREVLSYLVPNAWGNPSLHGHWWNQGSNFNESAGYVGIGAMLLAAFAWRLLHRSPTIRALCVLQLLSLGFILGVPLIKNSFEALPLFRVAANKRLLVVFCFANAAMAGLAFQALLERKRVSWFDVVLLGLIGLVFCALVLPDFFSRFASNPRGWIRGYGQKYLAHFFLFSLPFAVLLVLPKIRPAVRTGLSVGLVVLLAGDLFRIHFAYNPFISPAELYPLTPALSSLQAQPKPTRVLPMEMTLYPNITAIYGLQDPRIGDALTYRPLEQLLSKSRSTRRDPDLQLLSIAGVRYVWAHPDWDPEPWRDLAVHCIADVGPIYEVGNALPLAYVSHEWLAVSSPEEAYEVLGQAEFPWQSSVTIEERDDSRLPSGSTEKGCPHLAATIVEHRPHSVTVEIPEHACGLLVLNDCYYPDWRARVDGQQRPIYRVNGTFRGVFVKSGDRHVRFTYEPASFRYGLISSVAGVVIFLVVLLQPLSAIRRLLRVKERHTR
jgi:hypothetical protein